MGKGEPNGRTCIVKGCGKPLTGRQRKYCSIKCRRFSDKHRNRHYYLDYHKKRSKRIRLLDNDKRICVVCGGQLPKYKQKYCSTTCENEAQRLDHVNTNWYPAEKYIPLKCPECNGKVKIDGYDVVCTKCGLVME